MLLRPFTSSRSYKYFPSEPYKADGKEWTKRNEVNDQGWITKL